jgi:tetratricopeptide (TPR) repeat protein
VTEALAEGFALPPVSPPKLAPVLPFRGPAVEVDGLAAAVRAAEAAVAEQRFEEALAALEGASLSASPLLAFRALLVESWARMLLGELEPALAAAERARTLAEHPPFGDHDRAEALFRIGCCRYKFGKVTVAASTFAVALELCERSGQPCDRLRIQLFDWRSRCHQRHREWEAARADTERALELAAALGDPSLRADANFRASVLAHRTGQHLLARFYAEEARNDYEAVGNRLMQARILNNLGGFTFLLGDAGAAAAQLRRAAELALEADSLADAARARSSLAQVHLRTGRADLAEREAREALAVLAGRADFTDEIGNAQLVLGRALTEQQRADDAAATLAEAEATFAAAGAIGPRAAVWTAQGDLARAQGDAGEAASHYRRAAEALQDFHF